MPRVAPNVPAESDLLCEFCGYTLNGLPPQANCPECGKPVELSLAPIRQPSAWERDRRFLATSAEVIFRPGRFFKNTTTRGDSDAVSRFGIIHTALASILFAGAGTLHASWYLTFETGGRQSVSAELIGWMAIAVCTFCVMTWTTRLAARLTHWEATYRGIRLPIAVVQRGLAFHAAHYLPVAIVALATTAAYQFAIRLHPFAWSSYWALHATTYLYVLSGEVIVGAGYLFNTYWIAMRNMMYANH